MLYEQEVHTLRLVFIVARNITVEMTGLTNFYYTANRDRFSGIQKNTFYDIVFLDSI